MDGGDARAAARLEELVRIFHERRGEAAADQDNGAATPGTATSVTVHAGRDVVLGADRGPTANNDLMQHTDNAHHSLELHYALLGLVSFAVLLLMVIIFLLARRDLRPIKPSGAVAFSAVVRINPCDASFFLFLLGPMALKVRSKATSSPRRPALSRYVPRRSIHLSLHRCSDQG